MAGSSNGVLQLANETLTTSNTTNLGGGAIVGAPAVGSDKVIYVSTRGKKLFALDTAPGTPETATKLWEVDLGASSDSSPALDCSRDASGAAIPGRPGVLYVGADDGKLYAFITDSRGLDTTAPWPKFHRDPRNSADATVDLNTFKCP